MIIDGDKAKVSAFKLCFILLHMNEKTVQQYVSSVVK